MGAADDFRRFALLPSLSKRYRLVQDLPAGGEADVGVVSDSTGQRFVVKQYRRPDWAPADDVLDALTDLRAGQTAQSWAADPRTRHLVWLADWSRDPATGLFWELQEYLAAGSLASDPGNNGHQSARVVASRLRTWPPKELVAALADAVDGFHRAIGAHRDIKPGNVLVRSTSPLVLVLADVGLARQVGDLSVRISRRDGSAAYQAPEAAHAVVSRAGDWWAVGMMVAQAALGHHPLALEDGSLPDERAMLADMAQRDVPLDEITDPRLRLLCRGLLTRDADHRWRITQVRQWLAGDNPEVIGSSAVPNSARPTTRVRYVRFSGQDFSDPAALAAGLAADPVRAGQQLFGAKDPNFIEELRLFLSAHDLHECQAILDRHRSGAWQPSFLRLLVEMDPGLSPRLAGADVTLAGVAGVATAIIEAGSATREQAELLAWVREHDLWRIWRNQPGMVGAAEAADRLSQLQLRDAPVGRVVLIDDQVRLGLNVAAGQPWAASGWPSGQSATATTDPTRMQELVDANTVSRLTAGYRQVARAWVCLSAAAPERTDRELSRVIDSERSPLAGVTWWLELANDSSLTSRIPAAALLSLAHATKREIPSGLQRREQAAAQARKAEEQEKRRAVLQRERDAQDRALQIAESRATKSFWLRGPSPLESGGAFGFWVFVLWFSAGLIVGATSELIKWLAPSGETTSFDGGLGWALLLPWVAWWVFYLVRRRRAQARLVEIRNARRQTRTY